MKLQPQRFLILVVLLALLLPPMGASVTTPAGAAAAPPPLISETENMTEGAGVTAVAPWVWNIEVVDSAGNVGEYTSLHLDGNQRPRISYYGSGDLKYAAWNGAAWEVEVLDAAGDTGLWTSMDLYSAGGVEISYYDSTNGDLKVAHRGTGNETVDSTGDVGRYSSLVTDASGFSRISYYDATNGNLKYAYYNLGWFIVTLDSPGDVGRYTSLALRPDNAWPRIAYYDVTNGDLKYAWYDIEGWNYTTLRTDGDIGQWASLAVDSNNLSHIVYSSAGGGNLSYIYETSPGVWQPAFITAGVIGPTNIKLDSNNVPHVAFWTQTGLMYAHYLGVPTGRCANVLWDCELVDPGADVGAYPSLYLEGGTRPCISYRDGSNLDLKYAHGCVSAAASSDAHPACVSSLVHFTSTIAGGPVTSYLWNFGDGGTSSAPNPTHAYDTQGLYTVMLTVTASCGVAVVTTTAEVWGSPAAGYTYEPQPVCAAVPVSFTNTTVGSGTLSYEWNFGDGGSSFLPNPVHTFTNPGIYGVDLLAENECGFDLYSEDVQAHVGPQVGMVWSPDPAEIHQVVTFTAQTTSTLPVDLTWEFDDGTVATGPVATHIYDVAGTYPVTLTGVSGCGVDQVIADVVVVCYPPGEPDFAWLPVSPTVGFPIVFQGEEITGSTPFLFTWSFDDGMTATGEVVTHTYFTTGTFDVLLTVENDCGSDSRLRPVTVSAPPQAAFSSNAPVCLGAPVVFANESGGVPPLFYHWTFGDGITSTVENPTHTYALADTYSVTLGVTSIYGSDVVTHSVEVWSPAANASFTVQPLSPEPNEQVTFVGAAEGTTPLNYAWDFGDGTTGTGQVILHTYPVTGNYTVLLTVTNDCGEDTFTATVEVAYCTEPAGLGLSYTPNPPMVGDTGRYTASLDAGSEPIMFLWSFDDGITVTGRVVEHVFATVGNHSVEILAANKCGIIQQTFTIEVIPRMFYVYLPVITRGYFADVYEPDNTVGTAKELAIGVVQNRRIDPAGDVDWAYVDLLVGTTYTFETGDLGGTADTVLELYDTDGTTLLAQNDDCTGFVKWSCLAISAPASGRFYLKVRDYDPSNGGPANEYSLSARLGTR